MKQCKTLPFMFLRSMFVLFLSCLSVNTLGQSLTVSGTVTDEKGDYWCQCIGNGNYQW